jgi:hypothetical protein
MSAGLQELAAAGEATNAQRIRRRDGFATDSPGDQIQPDVSEPEREPHTHAVVDQRSAALGIAGC